MEDTVLEERLESEMDSIIGLESVDQENDMTFPDRVPNSDDWRAAINRVVPAVVVLRITACRSFDTEPPGSGAATGFVVDKLRGIILTNRHVVKPGPVVAQAIFINHEEIPVHPIYRDPVHDFGFYRYDPKAIQFLAYEEIPLAPEAASVGLEIRVIGNDSCEKVSILAGTIARLDRDAPTYRNDGYNDFNTFYMQAASGTKGGSSGSPVIDRQGRAVALNAGSKLSSSSAFYLPLDRVVRVLRFLQDGRDSCVDRWGSVYVPRGTLQVTFRHKGFDEARRLGLQTETEQMVRRVSPQGEIGMLVVDSVVPGGPSHRHLEPGDVLIRLNGEVTTQFLILETLLDDSVGQKIVLQIERGGVSLTKSIEVQDLHSITPDHFLEVSGAVLHPLSYQQARNFRFHCGLVYVSDPGYMLYRAGVPRHAIIKKFADVEISKLEDLISVLSKLCKGSRVPLEYITSKDRHRRKSTLVTLDRHDWYDIPKIYTRDDNSGLWTVKMAIEPKPLQLPTCTGDVEQGLESLDDQLSSLSILPPSMERMHETSSHDLTIGVSIMEAIDANVPKEALISSGSSIKINEGQLDVHSSADGIIATDYSSLGIGDPSPKENAVLSHGGETTSITKINASTAERVIEPTLVMLEVNVPQSCSLDGVRSLHSSGTGVIVHHSEDMGLVAVDRNIVEISTCDVMLSFAAFPTEIPGEVVFLHPVYNYALVAYNPSALGAVGASLVRVAELLPEPSLCRGDPVYLVGLSKSLRAKSRKSTVISSCAALNVNSSDCPQYRTTNMEVIELDIDFGNTFTGVLCDEHGKVQALWGSFTNKLKPGSRSSKDLFTRGIPIYMLSQLLHQIISGAKGPSLLINGVKRPMPFLRILEVELLARLLSKARSFGLPEYWIQALTKKDPMRKQVLRVKGCLAGSNAENLLKEGDMLLAINKEPVTCFRDIEDACHKLEKDSDNDGKLNLTIFRQGCQVDIAVGTNIRNGSGTTRAVNWCGCTVQEPHPAVRTLGFLPEEGHGVYVVKTNRGSPAERYGLYSLRWIVEVNGKPTPDLDSFVNVTKEVGSEEYVRVRTIMLCGKPQVLTLKPDLHYWPTWELRLDRETAIWRRVTIQSADCGAT